MIQSTKRILRSAKYSSRCFSVAPIHESVVHTQLATTSKNSQLVVTKSTLSNGINIATFNSSGPIVNLQFSVAAGSQFEGENDQGAAQLLSVAAFAGTQNRSGLDLCRYLETFGAKFHATVDRERVTYHVSVLSCYVDRVFSALASAVLATSSHAYVLDELKSTAQLFYDTHAHSIRSNLSELIHEAAYGENSGLGASMYASNLHDVNSEAVLNFRKKHFTKGNLTVTATGLEADELKELTKLFLFAVPEGKTEAPASPYIGGHASVKADLHGKSSASVAFPIVAGDKKGVHEVLHHTVSARLAKQGVNVVPFFNRYASGGIFGFHTMGSSDEVNKNLSTVASQMKAVATKLSENDVSRNNLAVSVFDNFASGAGTETLFRYVQQGMSAEDLDARNVSLKEVSAAANAALKASPAFAVYGKTRGVLSHNDASKLFQ